MNNRLIIKNIGICLVIFFSWLAVGYGTTQPKFDLIPTTPTTVTLPANGVTTVKYIVTNKTRITRTLTMTPITGITPITSGSGVCPNPFTLSQNQSCLLTLQLTGSQLPASVTTGPEVCKTMSANDNSPDPFLCSQPSQANSLHITRLANESVQLSVTPRKLTLQVNGSPGNLTVTNHSSTVTAYNISANISQTALNGNVLQDSSACLSLEPGQLCDLTFTPRTGGSAVTSSSFPIFGSNTKPVGAAIEVIGSTVAIITTSSPLILSGTTPETLIVTNDTDNAASNISANISSISAYVDQDASNCVSLAANSTCNLIFTPKNISLKPTPVNVTGTNASQTIALISINVPNFTISIINNTSPLAIPATAGAQGSMTVQNNSSQNMYNIFAHINGTSLFGYVTQISTTCTVLAPGKTCTLTFEADSGNIIAETGFDISATNLDQTQFATVEGFISLGSYFAYAADSTIQQTSTGSYYQIIKRCEMNITTGVFTNCIDSGATGLPSPAGLVIDKKGDNIYIANSRAYFGAIPGISKCTINSVSGALTGCINYTNTSGIGLINQGFAALAIDPSGTYIYATSVDLIQKCVINSDGTLTSCSTANLNSLFAPGIAINPNGGFAYLAGTITGGASPSIQVCTIDGLSNLISCSAQTGFSVIFPGGIAVNTAGTYSYITDSLSAHITQSSILSSGSTLTQVNPYSTTPDATATYAVAISKLDNFLYAFGGGNSPPIIQCPINPSSGGLGTCSSAIIDGTGGTLSPYGIALWQQDTTD